MVRHKNKKGQTLVEWAIVAPLLILTIFGMLQWCMIEIAHNLAFDAAYKAARAELVGEDAFDAAGITLLPIAGWNANVNLRASYSQNGGPEKDVFLKTGSDTISMDGWPASTPVLKRARFLSNRLKVTANADWEGATADVQFYYELVFPFVDTLFASVQSKQQIADGETPRTDEDGDGVDDIGISRATDISKGAGINSKISAKNFVELRARAFAPQIGRPRDSSINYGNWDGIHENPGEQLISRTDIIWTGK